MEVVKWRISSLTVSLFLLLAVTGDAMAAKTFKPNVPRDVTATFKSNAYHLTWRGDRYWATGYEVKWQQQVKGHWRWVSRKTFLPGSTRTSWSVAVSGPEVIYRFSMRAVNDAKSSRWTDWVLPTFAETNNLPVANAGNDSDVITGRSAMLDGSGSTDADGDALTYRWQMISRPLNSSTEIINATSPVAELIADEAGQYQVDLVVSDGKGDSEPDRVIINANANRIPVADAGADQVVAPGQVVTLDGSASLDPDNDALTYSWALVEKPVASQAVLPSSTSASPSFTPDLPGQYVAQLVVNDGYADSSAATVTITVTTLGLTVDTPADQFTTTERYLNVSGTIIDAGSQHTNIGILVNGKIAIIDRSVSPMKYIARVPLQPGSQQLTVTATSQYDETISRTLSVTRLAGNAYNAAIQPADGVAPHAIELELSLSDVVNNHIVRVEADFDDDGYADFSYDGIELTPEGNLLVRPLDLSQTIAFTYNEPGIYHAKVKVLDYASLQTGGNVLSEQVLPVEVVDENGDESLYTMIWQGMNDAVLAGDINRAATAFTLGSRGKYVPVLSALQPYYHEMVASYTQWQLASSRPGYMSFALNRDIDGVNRIFFVTFIQDHAGVWRILAM